MKLFIPLFLLLSLHLNAEDFTPNAYCKVPVADLCAAPINTFFKLSDLSAQELYALLPFDDELHGNNCPRIGQLLYNDPVEILEHNENEVRIKTLQWHYTASKKTNRCYWTLTSNIAPITKKTADYHPNNIPFKTDHQKIVALHTPLTSKKMRMTFSVGTRFVLIPGKKAITKKSYKVYCVKNNRVKIIEIPLNSAHLEELKPMHEARNLFVALLSTWITAYSNTAVPYLLGGSSYTQRYQPYDIQTLPAHGDSTHLWFERPNTSLYKAGFDCARLITRAAQLSGIALYAGNSTTLLSSLKPLGAHETPQNGDIIYFSGHVAVISDAQKGLLIEARSYTTGDGILQQIPFEAEFKGIKTIDDLVQAHHSKKKIDRLGKEGKKIQTIRGITLLKLF